VGSEEGGEAGLDSSSKLQLGKKRQADLEKSFDVAVEAIFQEEKGEGDPDEQAKADYVERNNVLNKQVEELKGENEKLKSSLDLQKNLFIKQYKNFNQICSQYQSQETKLKNKEAKVVFSESSKRLSEGSEGSCKSEQMNKEITELLQKSQVENNYLLDLLRSQKQ